jgi:hypothetical protein
VMTATKEKYPSSLGEFSIMAELMNEDKAKSHLSSSAVSQLCVSLQWRWGWLRW